MTLVFARLVVYTGYTIVVLYLAISQFSNFHNVIYSIVNKNVTNFVVLNECALIRDPNRVS